MKYIYLFLFTLSLSFNAFSIGDGTAPFKISEGSNKTIIVSFTPTITYPNLTAINFTINLPAGVTIINPLFNFGVGLVIGSEYGQSNFINSSFVANTEYIVMSFKFEIPANTSPNAMGNFTIANDGSNYLELGGGDRSGVPINNANNVLLPITLKSLTAKKFDESSALLEWTSASEVEASHYEVERSLDAQTWNYLATELVRGGNKLEASYTYLDRLSILQRSKPSIVYYRLKLVDLDGSYKYSDVRSVAFEELNEIAVSLYPNPASGQFQFAILSKDGINTATPLVLTDMTGKTVLTQNVTTNAITTISTAGLPVGIYHAHVTVDGQAVTKKIMINY